MHRATLLALLALTACPAAQPGPGVDGGSADAPIGPRDGGDADRPPGSGGLVFDLAANPTLPGVATGVSVDEVRVWLRDIRAIGDSAPGDSRTSLASDDLDFRSDRNPAPIEFPLAPPGLYSRLDARLGQASGGGSNGYEIRGHVTIAGRSVELQVIDDQATDAISVALGGLPVDGQTIVGVALDLSFLGRIDWSQVPHEDDKIQVGSSSPVVLQQVRPGVVAAWKLAP